MRTGIIWRVADRIVIIGAGGQVGSFLAARVRAEGRHALALTRAQWDVTDDDAGRGILRSGDVVINCAAYTDVDAAETDESAAFAVNAAGPGQIAAACVRAGARMIHISTDYVFSGVFADGPRPYEPDDETGPVNVYGRSKLAGERAVLTTSPAATVVRTAWVYTGGTGGDFVAVMRRLAGGDGTVAVVDDQVGSPTYVADLATALLQVADEPIGRRLLHAANAGAVSRYQQACAVFRAVGADPARVRPVGSRDVPRPAPRPRYSALSGVESTAAGLRPLPDWHAALGAALAGDNLSP